MMGVSQGIVWLLMICAALAQENASKSYLGYKAYMVTPDTTQQLRVLGNLAKKRDITFLQPISLGRSTTLVSSPRKEAMVKKLFEKNDIRHAVTLHDVGEYFQEEKQHQHFVANRRAITSPKNFMDSYLKYEEIEDQLQNWTSTYSKISRLESLGVSYEGRIIYIFKISDNFSKDKNRKLAMIEAGMHAREWIAITTALYIIKTLLENPSQREGMEYHIIVLANPDGYEYSFNVDRLWRKTRSNHGRYCWGVDGNRNFDFHWAEIGSSSDPCSDIYHGPYPFSEKETQAVKTALWEVRDPLRIYFSLHSYGPYILYPYGHNTTLPPDYKRMESLAMVGARKIEEMGKGWGLRYIVGNTARTLYPSGAGADDYAKNFTNAPYAYTIEVEGGGPNGFDPPPKKIPMIVPKVAAGIVHMMRRYLAISNVKNGPTKGDENSKD